MGGMVEAIEEGYPQREVAEASYRFQEAVERREKVIVGVNDFIQDDEPRMPILYIDDATAVTQLARLEQLRATRDDDRVRRSLDALAETARGRGNTMYPLIECARAYATVGEMCDALRQRVGRVRGSADCLGFRLSALGFRRRGLRVAERGFAGALSLEPKADLCAKSVSSSRSPASMGTIVGPR